MLAKLNLSLSFAAAALGAMTRTDERLCDLGSRWERVPECVREMVKALGLTTPWSVFDWYGAMDYAVTQVVERRRDAEGLDPMQCAALREQLFEQLGKLTSEQVGQVANFAASSGLGLRVAADVFDMVLDSRRETHVVIDARDGERDTARIEEFAEHVGAQLLPAVNGLMSELQAIGWQRAEVPVPRLDTDVHGWTVGPGLARRLGGRRR